MKDSVKGIDEICYGGPQGECCNQCYYSQETNDKQAGGNNIMYCFRYPLPSLVGAKCQTNWWCGEFRHKLTPKKD